MLNLKTLVKKAILVLLLHLLATLSITLVWNKPGWPVVSLCYFLHKDAIVNKLCMLQHMRPKVAPVFIHMPE